MTKITCTAIVVLAVATLLTGCDSGNGNNAIVVPPPPPPAPISWDQANWDEMVWQ